MKIGIDARFYGSLGKGLGRYTQKLIENLEKQDDQNEYFVFLCRENFDDYVPKNKNFHKVLTNYRWYTFSEQLLMPLKLLKYKLDLMHFPHFNVPVFYFGKFVVTIHDLILIHYPTIKGTTLNPLFYKIKFLAYRLVISTAIRRAYKIIAVSEFAKKDIFKNYKINPKKIEMIYEACDDFCLVGGRNVKLILKNYNLLDSRGIIRPYLIYIGNVYPHKNPENLVLGYALAKKDKYPDLRLVFVGQEDYFYRRLKKFIQDNGIEDVNFVGKLDDHILSIILRAAVLYGRPSFYEGFELPPLEAMACGVPVICSDRECAREILGDAAYYFNGHDPQDIAKSIKTVLMDKNLRQNLIEKGYVQVKKYSWKKMARDILEIYKRSNDK
jgi:glycosyltransferase involved in cell wall biosynthesis